MDDRDGVTRTATAIPLRSEQEHHKHLWNRRWVIILAVSLVSCFIVFTRRPDAFLNPQFQAEDGTYFYAQAYNLGALHALTIPFAGYLVIIARLVALIAMFFPLSWGPAIFNALGISLQVAPVAFLFTDRFDRLIPNWYARGAIAFLYIALPNSYELDAAMTYAQWHLALLAFLIVISDPRPQLKWQIFDGVTLLMAGLSGPFSIVLAPVIILRWFRTRSPHVLRLLAIDVVTATIQAIVVLSNISTGRAHSSLGVSGVELARIIAGQVFVVGAFGAGGYSTIYTTGWWLAGWLPVLIAIVGVTCLGFALSRAPQELRLLWLFSVLVLVAALVSPGINGPGTYWQRLAHPTWNQRYVFYPLIAWLTTLVWLVTSRSTPVLRRLALVLLPVACLVAVPFDWQYPAFADGHYQAYVQRFEELPSGSRLTIPLNPGVEWSMTLIKR